MSATKMNPQKGSIRREGFELKYSVEGTGMAAIVVGSSVFYSRSLFRTFGSIFVWLLSIGGDFPNHRLILQMSRLILFLKISNRSGRSLALNSL